jgi:acyl-CoA thioesterase-1
MAWTDEQLLYFMQFTHPEKVYADMPGMQEGALAALFGLELAEYRRIKAAQAAAVRGAAEELLADVAFAAQVDRLPLAPGATVVGVGDSITDDSQSWLEILRHVLAMRRAQGGLTVINAAVSGDTTNNLISRFVGVVQRQPDWILCMVGANDARRHGKQPSKVLVSLSETADNLAMMRHFAATETAARWIWLTPSPVIEEKIPLDWHLGPLELSWTNRDLAAIADLVRQQKDPVVDLQAAFGFPVNPDLLRSDGLHPSLAGQKVILRALVERWSAS